MMFDETSNDAVWYLNEFEYTEFMRMFEAPPQPAPKLGRLLSEPSPWEEVN